MTGLPPVVAGALRAGWGLAPTGAVEVARSPGSTTWRTTADDGRAYAVKVGRPGTTGGLGAAVALAADGVPGLAAPLPARDGAAYLLLEGDRPLSVVPWLDGVPALEAQLGRAHWRALGELLARVHAADAGPLAPARQPDPADLVARLEGVRRGVVAARRGAAVLGGLRTALREHGRALDRAARVLLTGTPAGPDRPLVPCHGDAHLGNVLLVDDRPVLLDWQDAGAAPRELDLQFVVDGAPPEGQSLERRVGEDELGWFTLGYGRALEPDRDELARQRTLRAVEDVVRFAEAALDPALGPADRLAQARWAVAATVGLARAGAVAGSRGAASGIRVSGRRTRP